LRAARASAAPAARHPASSPSPTPTNTMRARRRPGRGSDCTDPALPVCSMSSRKAAASSMSCWLSGGAAVSRAAERSPTEARSAVEVRGPAGLRDRADPPRWTGACDSVRPRSWASAAEGSSAGTPTASSSPTARELANRTSSNAFTFGSQPAHPPQTGTSECPPSGPRKGGLYRISTRHPRGTGTSRVSTSRATEGGRAPSRNRKGLRRGGTTESSTKPTRPTADASSTDLCRPGAPPDRHGAVRAGGRRATGRRHARRGEAWWVTGAAPG
jgi:hypothetical protein